MNYQLLYCPTEFLKKNLKKRFYDNSVLIV